MRALRAGALLSVLALAACAAPETRLGGTRDTAIGAVLVDGAGHTLYVHEEDRPGASRCTRPCTALWPPVEAPPGARADGPFTVIERGSGATQWAYNGRPLYRFAFDFAPGHVGGDGAGDGEWHAARP
jgi:predicted lipoprotein with Yx(FWY)xxD motif